jgi:hypothetical protein
VQFSNGNLEAAAPEFSKSFVARLRPSGGLNRSFGKKGIARFAKRELQDGAVDAHGRILLVGSSREGGPFIMRLRPKGTADRHFRNGLAGLEIFSEGEGVEAMYAGSHPQVFDLGGETGCRGYCKPNPVLYRFNGGSGKRHRR